MNRVGIIPNWSQLRLAGDSLPGRAVIVIPFLGYLLVSKESLEGIACFEGASSSVTSCLPFTSIYWTYFGLCFYGMGALIFQCFCSSLVKQYGNEDKYVSDMALKVSVHEISLCLANIRSDSRLSTEDKGRAAVFWNSLSSGVSNLTPEIVVFALTRYFRSQDITQKVARAISSLLIIIGLIVLFIPTFLTFYSICLYLLGHS